MAIQDNLNAIEGLAEVQEDIASIEEQIETGCFLNKESGADVLIQDGIESNIIDFKAYGRSTQDGTPTPDEPIDIASVGDGGVLEIKSCKKNLLKNTTSNKNTNGITYIINENGTVVVDGDCTDQTLLMLNYFTFKANTKYILSGCPSGGGIANGYVLFAYWNDGTSHQILDSGEGAIINMSEDTTCSIYISIYKGASLDNLAFYPMIHRAEIEDGTFEPYEESIVSIPLAEPLRGIGNVRDEIVCKNGVYGVLRRIANVVIDENSTIALAEHQGYNRFSITLTSNYASVSPYDNGYCTYMRYTREVLGSNTDDNAISVYTANNGTSVRAYFRMDKFSTVDELKAWLAENPVEVIYELATPYFEPFEDQTPFANIATFENITCISATDSPELEVVYYRNNTGGKKIAELDSNTGWRIFRTAGNGAGSGGASFTTSDIKYRKIGKTLEIIGTMTEFKPFQGSSIVFTCEDGDAYDIKSDIAHLFTIPAYDSEGNIYLVDITYNGIALYIKRHTHSTNQYNSVTIQNINFDILITI